MPEGVECPVCSASTSHSWPWKPPYKVHSCGACGLLFCHPMPTDEELAEFYDGFLYRKPDEAQIERLIAEKEEELVRLLGDRSELQGKSFLDFGGGTGIASAAATRLGMEVSFYEIDPQASEFVEQHFQLPEERTYSSVDEIPRECFDVVWADNVIEHVPRVWEFMDTMKSLLRGGGQAVIKTPHARNPEMWLYPAISVLGYARNATRYGGVAAGLAALACRRWATDPPRHVFSFSRASLAQLAETKGFASYSIEHYRTPLFEYLMIGHVFSIPKSIKAAVGWPVYFALALVELLLKLLYFPLNLWPHSAGGVILRTKR